MNERINNVCKVEAARRSEVAYFYETPTGLAVISAPWSTVPLARNARMSINQVVSGAGDRFDVDFEANLSQSWLLQELCLVKVTFADGRLPMLIGSMDFPVKLRASHSLTYKTLTFSHSNSHYPYRVSDEIPEPGSDIPDPEPEPEPASISWQLAEWDATPDFVDANMRIYANEVLKLEQYGNGSGTVNVFKGDTIRTQYFYLDIAEGSPADPKLQLLIDEELIDSRTVDIPGTDTFNHSFVINSDIEVLVRAVDLG